MSLRRIVDSLIARALVPALLLLAALPASAQYPGQVSKDAKEAPVLRSIGVLEWTGPEEHPKASRLVPVLVYDNGQMQDGSIYLARPEPIAVAPEVEYELEEEGKLVGLYDVQTSGQQLGSWVGFGKWKPMPAAPRTPPKPTLPEWGMDNQEGDRPTLHRKKHPDEASSSGTTSSSGQPGSAAPSDPDRPVLRKSKSADSDDSSAGASSAGSTRSLFWNHRRLRPSRPPQKGLGHGQHCLHLSLVRSRPACPQEKQETAAVSCRRCLFRSR